MDVSPSLRLEKLQKRREQRDREQWPVEKQIVRLPASSGAPPAIELEDLHDFCFVNLPCRLCFYNILLRLKGLEL